MRERERGSEKGFVEGPKQITKRNKLHQSTFGVRISNFLIDLLSFMHMTNKNNSIIVVFHAYKVKNKSN